MIPPVKPKKPSKRDAAPKPVYSVSYALITDLENDKIRIVDVKDVKLWRSKNVWFVKLKLIPDIIDNLKTMHPSVDVDSILIEPSTVYGFNDSSSDKYLLISADVKVENYQEVLKEYYNRFDTYEERLTTYLEEKRKYDIWKLKQKLNELETYSYLNPHL